MDAANSLTDRTGQIWTTRWNSIIIVTGLYNAPFDDFSGHPVIIIWPEEWGGRTEYDTYYECSENEWENDEDMQRIM
jgi:hypothetical protein